MAGNVEANDSKNEGDETCSKYTDKMVSYVEKRENSTQILCLNELMNSYVNVLTRYSYPKHISTRTFNQLRVGVNFTTDTTQEIDRRSRDDRPLRTKISGASPCDFSTLPNVTDTVDIPPISIVSHQDAQRLNAKEPNACELDSILTLYNAYETNKMDLDDPLVRCLDFKRNELNEEGYIKERLAGFYVYGISPAR